jgi:aspartyl protease family protein
VQKLVLFLLFGSVFVGAMMPSNLRVPKEQSQTHSVEDRSSFFDRSRPSDTKVDLGTGTVTLDRNADGHFYADAQINGTPVHFLIDTGATGIALTHEDAQRAGVPMSGSSMVIGQGAGGELTGEIVSLDRVGLGPKEVRTMPAAVIDGGDQSLLGQSFLSQFASVSIEDDKMVLR